MASRSNNIYWRERMAAQEVYLLEEGQEYFDYVERQYREAMNGLQADIDTWYRRFADNNEISFAEAKQRLTAGQMEELRWSVEDYIRYGQENAISGQWAKQLENASTRVHVTRLEALQLEMQQRVEVLFGNQLDGMDRSMRNLLTEGYYHTAFELQKGVGLDWDVAGLDSKRLDLLLRKPWSPDGENFSAKLWGNRTQLLGNLETHLTQSLIRGDSPDKVIDLLAKDMDRSKNAAARLVLTESAYFASAGQQECYRELGVERYEIVATLDDETSELCQSLDGQVFAMKDYQPGVTAPPFHPWCRSATAPYFEDDEGQRAARDAQDEVYYVSADTTYGEWKKQQQGGIMVPEGDAVNMKPIAITDQVIDELKTPPVEGWPDSMNDQLNREHQELLRLAQQYPAGVEVAVRYGDNFIDKTVSVGSVGNVLPNLTTGRIYMHNHPSGNAFTLQDVERILFHENMDVLTAVGNNGSVYLLEKTDQYNFAGIYRNFQSAVERAPDFESTPEAYIGFMENFLTNLGEHGLIYRKSR